MKRILVFIACLLLLPEWASGGDSSRVAIRGLWIIRHQMTRPERIDRFLETAYRLGFTDLFVQVRGRGDAYYDSRFEPRADVLAPDFDPLDYLLRHPLRAHFRIHAWVNAFYIWSKPQQPEPENHLANQRRDWLARPYQFANAEAFAQPDRFRAREGFYVSPRLPEVQRHLQNVIEDILSRYAVDGIHLDYIRYPGPDFDFHPDLRRLFRMRYVIDPLEFKQAPDRFQQKYTRSGYEFYLFSWAKFLRDGLSDFVKRLSQRIRDRYPQRQLTAAVKPDLARAHWEFYQHWDRWVNEGWLDFVLPMNYTPANSEFVQRIRIMLREVHPEELVMGISLYNQSPEQVIQKIRLVEEIGLKGYTLFSFDQIEENPLLERMLERYLSRGDSVLRPTGTFMLPGKMHASPTRNHQD
ncbi:MAG: family 10 glycosylhydrolase [Calditrichaeota bacterium]|nr:family 10 glycosylhydrolase [Calditrichota bacterium]